MLLHGLPYAREHLTLSPQPLRRVPPHGRRALLVTLQSTGHMTRHSPCWHAALLLAGGVFRRVGTHELPVRSSSLVPLKASRLPMIDFLFQGYLLPYAASSLAPLFGIQLSLPTSREGCYPDAGIEIRRRLCPSNLVYCLPPPSPSADSAPIGNLRPQISVGSSAPGVEGEGSLRSHRKGELG